MNLGRWMSYGSEVGWAERGDARRTGSCSGSWQVVSCVGSPAVRIEYTDARTSWIKSCIGSICAVRCPPTRERISTMLRFPPKTGRCNAILTRRWFSCTAIRIKVYQKPNSSRNGYSTRSTIWYCQWYVWVPLFKIIGKRLPPRGLPVSDLVGDRSLRSHN